LFSEASYRFARGIPATLNAVAARRAAELLRRYAGGRIVPGMVDAYPVPQAQPVVYTTERDMRRLLGMPVTLYEVRSALQRLDFSVRRVSAVDANAPADATFALAHVEGEPFLEAVPPWHRLDVRIPADLTEEVARIIGYEHVGMAFLNAPLPPQRHFPVYETEEHIRDVLVGAGLQEIINRTLTTPEEHDKLRVGGHVPYVELANPAAPERRVMRRSLLVSAVENLARNLRYSERLATFEVGRVYLPEEGDGTLPKEERRVSLLMAGPRTPRDFYHPDPDAIPDNEMDFFDIKGVIETLLDRLGFKPAVVEYRALPDTETFSPRCAEVWVNGVRAGVLGELHPSVRAAYGLPAVRVALAELLVDALVKPHWGQDPMIPISNYPQMVEDLAFEVSEEITVRRVHDVMVATADARLVDVELFDLYRGEPLAPGNKSLAFRLTYQSNDRPLTEKEVTYLRQRIVAAVEKETGGKLRS
jgi:phenylalanyl-tRNA synthetase beta chain